MHRATWPSSTSHVQHTACLSKVLLDEGKDLFLVFAIGPLGKPLLPPSRMLLPEGIADHRCEASYISTC